MSFMAAVATTSSIVLSSSKIQNGDVLVPVNLDPPGKMAVKIEGERERGSYIYSNSCGSVNSLDIHSPITWFNSGWQQEGQSARIAPVHRRRSTLHGDTNEIRNEEVHNVKRRHRVFMFEKFVSMWNLVSVYFVCRIRVQL